MSVEISTLPDRKRMFFSDKNNKEFSYQTTDAGVLRVITTEDSHHAIALELSPSGWASVGGDRFLSVISDRMKGTNQTTEPGLGSAPMPV